MKKFAKACKMIGPGGINCPCCLPRMSKKEAKRACSKLDRREAKAELRKAHD